MSVVLLSLFQSQTNSKAEVFTQAFLRNSIQQHSRHDLKNMLSHKAVILGYTRPKKDKSKRSSKKAKGLNARQKRAMKIFQIKPEHQRLVRDPEEWGGDRAPYGKNFDVHDCSKIFLSQ